MIFLIVLSSVLFVISVVLALRLWVTMRVMSDWLYRDSKATSRSYKEVLEVPLLLVQVMTDMPNDGFVWDFSRYEDLGVVYYQVWTTRSMEEAFRIDFSDMDDTEVEELANYAILKVRNQKIARINDENFWIWLKT